MPKVKAGQLTVNYESQGSGEPIILIPYLAADNACYAFQVAEYAKHFTCISMDLPGTGESDPLKSGYSTEDLADHVNGFMQALGLERAHFSGLSLGAAVGMWMAAKYPSKVASLSLHSSWPKTDEFIKAVLESWQTAANSRPTVADMVIQFLFPWCFTPELYQAKPDYIASLAQFVKSRPAQSLAAFIEQSNAVIAHDVDGRLSDIAAPTLMTFGRYDMVTSLRFAERLKNGIHNSELLIFEGCAHAPIYERVEEFNTKTLEFLKRQQSDRKWQARA